MWNSVRLDSAHRRRGDPVPAPAARRALRAGLVLRGVRCGCGAGPVWSGDGLTREQRWRRPWESRRRMETWASAWSGTLPVTRPACAPCVSAQPPSLSPAFNRPPAVAPHPAACSRESGAFVVVATLASGPARTSGDILPVAALPPCLPLGRVLAQTCCARWGSLARSLTRSPACSPAR